MKFTEQLIKRKKKHTLENFRTIISLGREIYNGIVTLNDAFVEEVNSKYETGVLLGLKNEIKKKKKN